MNNLDKQINNDVIVVYTSPKLEYFATDNYGFIYKAPDLTLLKKILIVILEAYDFSHERFTF